MRHPIGGGRSYQLRALEEEDPEIAQALTGQILIKHLGYFHVDPAPG